MRTLSVIPSFSGLAASAKRAALVALASAALAAPSIAQIVPSAKEPEALRDITRTSPSEIGLKVDEKLGAPLPLELRFTNAEGQRHQLADYFTHKDASGAEVVGKPAIIALVYYRCPVVCSTLLTTINDCLRDVKGLEAGGDYNVLTFSFDPADDKFAAESRKKSMVLGYGRGDTQLAKDGWQFFLHEEGSTRQLANALGFQYRPIEGGQDFAHPVVFFIATPDGKISRYLYGFGHSAMQLRLALLDAGQGSITPSLKDQFLTFCYMYDPKVGMYTLSAIRVMQAGGIVTLVGLAGLIGVLLLTERMRARRSQSQAASAAAPNHAHTTGEPRP